MSFRVADTADVDPRAKVGPGASIWHLAQVREHAEVGQNVVVGRGAYIGSGVLVGDNSKIQNYALVYEPAVLEAGVFVGPAAVLTNDTYPRAVNPDGSLKSAADWEPTGVTVRAGAAIGARAVCIAPVEIGRWATVAAGAVVSKNVPDYALVAGVPAKRVGWVGPSGVPLQQTGPDRWVCPSTGDEFQQDGESLAPLSAAADEELQ